MSAPPLPSSPVFRDESSELAPTTIAVVRSGLVVGLVGVAGVAFVVSWTALHDVGRAIGLADLGALLYPLAADGPIALALVASLVLSGRHRRAALLILGIYTAASLILNYVHGLMPLTGTRPRLSPTDWVHYALVGVAASLPVGSIFSCADLVTRVLRSARPAVAAAPVGEPEQAPALVEQQVERVDTPVDTGPARRRRWGRKAVAPAEVLLPALESTPAKPDSPRLEVICGAGELYRPVVPGAVPPPQPPAREPEPEAAPEQEPGDRLSAEYAAQVIEQCWRDGLSVRKTAPLATRSTAFVGKVFQELETRFGPRPVPGQLEMPGSGGMAA